MTIYRKKPVKVEAVRVPYNEWADNPLGWEETPEWLQAAFDNGTIKPVFRGEDYWYYDIATLEGVMTADPDCYLIRGVEGELYPCKAGIFRATYTEVTEADRLSETALDDLVSEMEFAESIHRANTGVPGKYGEAARLITELRQRLAEVS